MSTFPSEITISHQVADAAYPRHTGGTLLSSDRLRVAYVKYGFPKPAGAGAATVSLNLIFTHGTGMNKSLWKYYVNQLYKYSSTAGPAENWYIDKIIAPDAVTHGDLAMLNGDKLGWLFRWEDGGRDINSVVKHEQLSAGDFVNSPTARTLLVGHSLGANLSIFAVLYEPMLYDSAFLIEPVAYKDEASLPKSAKMITSLSRFLKDDFESELALEDYFTKKGVLRKFHPTILRDVLEDEKLEVKTTNRDGEAEVRWRTKASVPQQLNSYVAGAHSIPQIMKSLPLIGIPVVHVGALKGRFNPPATIPFVRRAVPAEYITGVDIPNGEHNVNGELPDEIIDELKKWISSRAQDAIGRVETYPEVQHRGDRKKIFAVQLKDGLNTFAELLKDPAGNAPSKL